MKKCMNGFNSLLFCGTYMVEINPSKVVKAPRVLLPRVFTAAPLVQALLVSSLVPLQ